jgi:nucleotide-binding universal stress UspA family protein
VLLLTVLESEPMRALVVGGDERQRMQIEEAWRSPAEGYLAAVATRLAARHVRAEYKAAIGDPVDQILAEAEEERATLIVMATHGRSGLQRLLLGSVADKVMRMSTRPVLLIRPQEEVTAPSDEPAAIRRVAVPLDGSHLAEAALPVAVDLARMLNARLSLIRVEPLAQSLIVPFDLSGSVPDFATLDERIAAAAEAYLGTVRSRLPVGIKVETLVVRGSPAPTLLEVLERDRVDLVVMSTHGWGGLRRFVLGSVTERVVRAGIPTVVVRPVEVEAKTETEAAAPRARYCANCGRLITFAVRPESRCPRCRMHLHSCPNCVFWDSLACVLQRPEAHDALWPGRNCPRFIFRETPAPATPRPSAPREASA